MPISTLINAVMHWASGAFSTKEATADAQATADAAQAMAGVVVVTLTEAEDGTVTADMTVDEVAELVEGGRRVVAVTPFSNRVAIEQASKTTSDRNMVLGTLLSNSVATTVAGTVLASGDEWTVGETAVNTATDTTLGDFTVSVDSANGALETFGNATDGGIRSRTMALATDLEALEARVAALEAASAS